MALTSEVAIIPGIVATVLLIPMISPAYLNQVWKKCKPPKLSEYHSVKALMAMLLCTNSLIDWLAQIMLFAINGSQLVGWSEGEGRSQLDNTFLKNPIDIVNVKVIQFHFHYIVSIGYFQWPGIGSLSRPTTNQIRAIILANLWVQKSNDISMIAYVAYLLAMSWGLTLYPERLKPVKATAVVRNITPK